MKAAPRPRPKTSARLLVLDPRDGKLADSMVAELPAQLNRHDLLVVNDAATLPASLPTRYPDGTLGETRLTRARADDTRWQAVLFGSGDWRTPTEHRATPPLLRVDAVLEIAGLPAEVTAISPASPRLVELHFLAPPETLWPAIYRRGRPVQYAHVPAPLALWSVQTAYATRPWAVEAPSAGLPLDWQLLVSLRARGIDWAAITHTAGLSATGDVALDARLPLPEQLEVSAGAVAKVAAAKALGGRVVAVGTSVVRALESAAIWGELRAVRGDTDLVIGPGFVLRVVDGLLTGLHEPTASHFALLQAFARRDDLERAYAHAEAAGYLSHEFGDLNLILPTRSPR